LTDINLYGSPVSAAHFDYNQLSQRTQIIFGNGTTVAYNPQLNEDVIAVDHYFVGSGVAFTYLFDNVHEPLSINVSDSSYLWNPPTSISTSYGTMAAPGGDDVNKYLVVAGTTYNYDGNKNLTGDGTWTYAFDTENQLLSANMTGVASLLVYDPLRRQSQKTVGSAETRYIYSGWQRIADYDGVLNTLQNRYIYGTAMDDVLIEVSSSGTVTFLHADRMGSIVATSKSDGTVASKNMFGPFGEPGALGGTTFGFTGQRYDVELGLYYYKRRYYSPNLGRFLQTDPSGYTGEDFNLYTYVRNSPLRFADPMGLVAKKVIKGIVGKDDDFPPTKGKEDWERIKLINDITNPKP
jgi:RHS repeat-associated protein